MQDKNKMVILKKDSKAFSLEDEMVYRHLEFQIDEQMELYAHRPEGVNISINYRDWLAISPKVHELLFEEYERKRRLAC